ncbi:hypothetical protein Hanom_Chr10g00881211 [Helianthus anomalus]
MSSFCSARRARIRSSRPRMRPRVNCIIFPTTSGSRAGGCSQNRPSICSCWSFSFSARAISC